MQRRPEKGSIIFAGYGSFVTLFVGLPGFTGFERSLELSVSYVHKRGTLFSLSFTAAVKS